MSRAYASLFFPVLLTIFLTRSVPAGQDTTVIAHWHCDEPSGMVLFDSSGLGHDAYLSGTIAVNGVAGMARHFNGGWDYGEISYPSSMFLNMSDNESFEISLWVRTTATEGTILRRGLAPTPGFLIGMHEGHVVGIIGNREDSSSPDTLLRITSSDRLNDATWHQIVLTRDRQARTINLRVDGVQEPPSPDPVTFPLASDRPMTLGRWENNVYPSYFFGDLDEIAISTWGQEVIGADTLLLLRFNEASLDQIVDASQYKNMIFDYGTSHIPGFEGSARAFDGNGSYLDVRETIEGVLDFGAATSFTVDCMFRTTSPGYQIMLRKGLAPIPGFALEMMNGHVRGLIGNREDGIPPDTVLDIRSDQKYNDGLWHRATLVRDRGREKLFLYVDGRLACRPMEDLFDRPLVNAVDLNIGRWEFDYDHAAYFAGILDNVGLYRGARHPQLHASLQLSDSAVVFPKVVVGDTAVQTIRIGNLGIDTLRVSIRTVSHPALSATAPDPIPAFGSDRLTVRFIPVAKEAVVGVIELLTNDPAAPIVLVHVRGDGVTTSSQPVIRSIVDIPHDQGRQVRVTWYRSSLDTLGVSPALSEYSLWRRVQMTTSAPAGRQRVQHAGEVWDFVATIPAVGFSEYGYVAPTLADSSRRRGMQWSVFLVSAMIPGQAPLNSLPDSGFSVDNLCPGAPTMWPITSSHGELDVRWDPAQDGDLMDYVVERSVMPADPSLTDIVGVVTTTSFHDASPPGQRIYYRVLARDSAGNPSAGAAWVEGIVLSVDGDGGVPRAFALHQNFPNPFNPSTTIRYDLPTACHVTFEIYNALGQRVGSLVSERQSAGRYEVRFDAADLPSGVYFGRLLAGSFVAVDRLSLIK